LNHLIKEAIGNKQILEMHSVNGGSINDAYYVRTKSQEYFIKLNIHAPKGMFEKECDGLLLLENTGQVKVPKVYTYSDNYLVLEWKKGKKQAQTQEQLGREIAALHQSKGDFFGLNADNFIGKLPQINKKTDNWLEFFRDHRLGYQLDLAEKNGNLTPQRRELSQKLLDSLDKWIPKEQQPVLLHGDLWGGNWIVGDNGEPYLIDPAVFYGEREFEIAFTEMFDGFSPIFYAAYEEVLPLSKGYDERKRLYQLYYILVHLNIFGEIYGRSVDRILKYYVE
jgi:fructosamine-3-kinase